MELLDSVEPIYIIITVLVILGIFIHKKIKDCTNVAIKGGKNPQDIIKNININRSISNLTLLTKEEEKEIELSFSYGYLENIHKMNTMIDKISNKQENLKIVIDTLSHNIYMLSKGNCEAAEKNLRGYTEKCSGNIKDCSMLKKGE